MAATRLSRKDRGACRVDDVSFQGERKMRLVATAHQLGVPSQGKDIVTHGIFPAVMLVKTGGSYLIDDIVCRDEPAAPFVEIDTPAAIIGGGDVGDHVMVKHVSRTITESVNTA